MSWRVSISAIAPGLEVVRIRADVPDVRVRQRDDLPVIRRIGENLLITGHRGVEHHFAEASTGGTDGDTAKYGSVFER